MRKEPGKASCSVSTFAIIYCSLFWFCTCLRVRMAWVPVQLFQAPRKVGFFLASWTCCARQGLHRVRRCALISQGEWDNFTEWGECSASCGGGTQKRTRSVKARHTVFTVHTVHLHASSSLKNEATQPRLRWKWWAEVQTVQATQQRNVAATPRPMISRVEVWHIQVEIKKFSKDSQELLILFFVFVFVSSFFFCIISSCTRLQVCIVHAGSRQTCTVDCEWDVFSLQWAEIGHRLSDDIWLIWLIWQTSTWQHGNPLSPHAQVWHLVREVKIVLCFFFRVISASWGRLM